ncbi:protoglobin domain-containing protein [Anoxybacteroides amylolyticum]|uniref:HD domain protein n=1 Tax=Anoxybacteroides amylolyticum TaxID=294699 RepID=A0A160F1U1_9BACL|nr:protoglobin domain-containing protein [Anoxybacillus amylolyticus]ANB59393.1 HD domain protein [Anoxybacillus amylolyticus]
MKRIRVTNKERLQQLSYTGVTEERLEYLREYRHILFSLIDAIVSELYEDIWAVDSLRDVIQRHSTLERLKKTQAEYLHQCFEATIDDEYIERRYRIGKVHSEIGLDLMWYLATYTKYLDIIYKHVSAVLPKEATNILLVVQTIFSFDMQLTLEAYKSVEIEKAAHPLRYELDKLRQVHGFTNEDLENLEKLSGYISFCIDDIMNHFYHCLVHRLGEENRYSFLQTEKYLSYIRNFLLQFFQEKVYCDSEAYFLIIRDWSRLIIEQRYQESFFHISSESIGEALKKVFLTKEYLHDPKIVQYIHSFERFSKFTLAIMNEIIRPYLFLRDFDFLDIYAYEISTIDFGRLTWIDDKMKRLLKTLGIDEEHPIGRRCYELLHNRTVPCSGCPALEGKSEPMMATFMNEHGVSYYKIRILPQTKIFELSRALLVIQDVTKESKVMFDTLERLLQLAEYRDDDTKNHVHRIGMLSRMLARLAGCDEQFVSHIEIAAKFHDIGKVGIPDYILNKPGKLTKEEWESMKTHVLIGHQILANLDLPVIQMAANIARTHHEWWNGGGYPNGLKGEEIPLEGRIVAIVDVFDALLSKRVYKEAFPPEKVKEILIDGRGKQFDPKLVDLFVSMWDDFLMARERLV